jgi:hypothetical protein
MTSKICSICKNEKDLNEFHKGKTKDGYQYRCKICKKEYAVLHKELENNRKKNWKLNNIEKVKESKKKYYEKNKKKEIVRNTNRSNERKKTDIIFKLSCNIRTRIYNSLKNKKFEKNNKTFEIIGCDGLFLKTHLESLFTSNMCWENYGEWHVDHIIPLSSSKNLNEFYKLCHYTNLQPLWAHDNLKKGSKIVDL